MGNRIRRRGTSNRPAVTISDVARAVGVATSTVSRALSQPGRISETMSLRIQAVATELGYHPNPQARSLTSGRTHSIALLIPGATNPYFFDLIRGTQNQAKSRDYRHVLVDFEASRDLEATALAELPASVDGIVLTGSQLSDDQLLEASKRIPLVVVNREIDGIPSVVVDTSTGIAQALEYLASLGHTRIAFLAGPASSWSSRKRWEALEKAAQRLKVECLKIDPFTGPMHSGAAAVDAALPLRVTACLFFNDMLAISALKRFKEHGIAVPEEMSVVGCDDIFGANFCCPPLTTLTSPIEQVGRLATDMLLTKLLGHPLVRTCERVPARLTIRDSTAIAH